MLHIYFLLFSFSVFANSLFYIPSETKNDEKKHEFTHKSYMEVLYGNSNTTKGDELKPFNRFQQGRLNARSVLQVKDLQNKYSALLDVQIGTDVNEDRTTMFYIHQGYIELQNTKEQPIQTKVRIGIQNTANKSLSVNSSTSMKNNQGINGNWYRFIQMPVVNQGGGYNPTFILQSNPLSFQGFTDATFLYSTNSGNLNFVQPSPNWSASNVGLGFSIDRFHGFKLAFSYQPSQNTGNFGINANGGYDRRGIQLNAPGNSMFTKNLTSVVLNYLNEFGGVAINTSIGYETAGYHTKTNVVNIERNRLSQYTAGLNLSYIGLTLGGSYSNAGQSILLKPNLGQVNSFSTHNSNNSAVQNATSLTDLYNLSKTTNLLQFKDSYNYDLGISYSISRFQAGVSHARSYFAGNKFNATIFSLSEDLASSNKIKLTTIYELGVYQFNSSSYFEENNGTVLIKQVPQMKGIFGSVGLRVTL